jgi:hypothetical protein
MKNLVHICLLVLFPLLCPTREHNQCSSLSGQKHAVGSKRSLVVSDVLRKNRVVIITADPNASGTIHYTKRDMVRSAVCAAPRVVVALAGKLAAGLCEVI